MTLCYATQLDAHFLMMHGQPCLADQQLSRGTCIAGVRGKTPVEQSSGAFTEDTTADSSASQTTSHPGTGQEPLKLGTTAAQHASTRNAGSGSPTGINSPSAASAGTAGVAGPSPGQAGPRLGTTAFEHALSRTSGNPLNRPSGTPGSPQTSFKGSSAVTSDPASGGMQGTPHLELCSVLQSAPLSCHTTLPFALALAALTIYSLYRGLALTAQFLFAVYHSCQPLLW